MRNQIIYGGVGRHETFTPRYRWLKKGFDAAKVDGNVFSAPDAIERLGVGKNMVRSIRFWCLAFHLLTYKDGHTNKGQKGALVPTKLGNKLLDDDGWDPYLEDIASLWLLHWQIFEPPFQAASWSLAFNDLKISTFDIKQLNRALISASQQYEKLMSLSENSYEKDASCIIRMYASASQESSFDIESPFSQIAIIREAEEPKTYRFDLTAKQSLPSLIFVAACFSYAYHTQPNQRSLSLHKILFDFNSPGIVFKISETDAGRHLDAASRLIDGVDFVETMGYRALQFNRKPDELFWEALENYYSSNRKRNIEI